MGDITDLEAKRQAVTAVLPQTAAVDDRSGDAREDLPAVPGYEILGELGRGGMGVVYRAQQTSLKRVVALKMILGGLHADSTTRIRFRTEAEAVARLQHPNIVHVYEVGEHDGRPFLALEYVEGASLQEKLAHAAQSDQEAALLLEQLARAVHYTHQRGILHRDLKPTNILLTADGTPKITDFGLAKLVDQGGGPTQTEVLIGTPHYMSPEQAAGNTKKIGVPADVYSLGAILYELLAGRVPFHGNTILNTLEQVRTQEPVSPRRLRRTVARDLETICLKCLEKQPGNRYASAEALADDLRCFMEGRPIQARPIPIWQRWARSARRHPALVASVFGAVALLGALLASWWYAGAAAQLKAHRIEARYQNFVDRRDEAFFYGLLAPEQGALFVGTDATANLASAESAAREALALAGINQESAELTLEDSFSSTRKAEMAADCYSLLLLLASIRAQQQFSGQDNKDRFREALQILDSAPGLGFKTQAYHLRRAHLLEMSGRHVEARKERQESARIPPEVALDHFLIGEEDYRRGNCEEAKISFDRALALQPAHFWSRFFLAVCHLKMHQWEAAKAGLNACLTQHPDFVWAYLFRSFANEKLHALAEAEVDFQKAIQLNPKDDARYVLFLTRGILHFDQSELDRAAADFRSALAIKPYQYNAYLNLAHVQLAQGRFEEAAAQVEKARELRPPVEVIVAYHIEQGRNLLREKRFTEALKACDTALELNAPQVASHEIRGHALLGLGQFDEAELAFDRYLANRGEATTDLFRSRGMARMKLGKYLEAAEDYRRALDRGPDAETYQHRGWAHFFSDAWKLALRDFSRAVELDPTAGDAYTGRGLALVMLGSYRDAVSDADSALRLKPATPEMMHNIACIFAQAVARAETTDPKAPEGVLARYRTRALDAIQRTLEMLRPAERASFWTTKILPDTALAPVHNEPAFQKLRSQFAGAKAKKR